MNSTSEFKVAPRKKFMKETSEYISRISSYSREPRDGLEPSNLALALGQNNTLEGLTHTILSFADMQLKSFTKPIAYHTTSSIGAVIAFISYEFIGNSKALFLKLLI